MNRALPPHLEPWLRLSLVPGVGPATFIRLLQEFGDPQHVFDSTAATLSRCIPAKLAQAILGADLQEQLTEVSDWLNTAGNTIITLADEHYPQLLLQADAPPPLLYAKGSLWLLNQPSIAIVGSRNATAQGMETARQFASHLSQAGLTVVSGMAAGIDRAAHEGGLAGAGSSIAVIGTGLDRVYPARNRDLAHQLAESGLIVSEFPLGTQPLATNFPRRNRIISGLSLGCLVVESTMNSGSLVTARLATEQGREVMAIPGSIHSPQSRGCHHLIKQGAKLVETAQDVLEELRWQTRAAVPASGEPPALAVDGESAAVLTALGFDPQAADQLGERTGLTPDKVCAILLKLELEGLVSCLPGGRYQRICR